MQIKVSTLQKKSAMKRSREILLDRRRYGNKVKRGVIE